MNHGLYIICADHVRGHVDMAKTPYIPHWGVPIDARNRFQPWACTFHTADGEPSQFIAFGGQAGMIDAVYALMGPLLLKMHGGLFETLSERVHFVLDDTPLQDERLALVADTLEAFIASPSFLFDCSLVGADPREARLHLETMRASIKNRRSLVL